MFGVLIHHMRDCMCVFQGDKSGSWSEAGGGDSDHISQTHREHRPHLLRFFHRVRHSWSPGKHLYCIFPVLTPC